MYGRFSAVVFLLLAVSCGGAAWGDPKRDNMTMRENGDVDNTYADERGQCEKVPMEADGIVRLSKIEVYPEYLDEYARYAAEVGEISLRTEPGVLTMHALCEKDNPCTVTILETYASQDAYRSHIASEHFRRYKQATLHMVKTLTLSDQTPLDTANRICNFILYNHE